MRSISIVATAIAVATAALRMYLVSSVRKIPAERARTPKPLAAIDHMGRRKRVVPRIGAETGRITLTQRMVDDSPANTSLEGLRMRILQCCVFSCRLRMRAQATEFQALPAIRRKQQWIVDSMTAVSRRS